MVITGIGIVSSIGNNKHEVLESLQEVKSGLSYSEEFNKYNYSSQVYAKPSLDIYSSIDRKIARFMGDGAAYAYLSMREAIEDANLEESQVSNPRTGIICGTGGTSFQNTIATVDIVREKGIRKVGPFMVPRIMNSSAAANLAVAFKIKGINYSISSACATSAHSIGNGMELIQWNKQDIVFAGGGEEVNWIAAAPFDAMGALSSKYNETPQTASRPYDANRDGFVIAGGGGILVLEELEHALARGAKIYAELIGYGATSDGNDMVRPSGEGAVRAMRLALENNDDKIDYINTHGTSTPAGDIQELEAIGEIFGNNIPPISSTKALTGHSLGAAGVQEAIYSILMMENSFLTPSANIEILDQGAKDFPILRKIEQKEINTALSNSFGFGGTNASLVFRKFS